jgi:hypothetical protein
MKRMACNNSRWKAANQSKDRRIRRRRRRRNIPIHNFMFFVSPYSLQLPSSSNNFIPLVSNMDLAA